MLHWPSTHTNDYAGYTTVTADYVPIQKSVYIENHIYKRRNRQASLAKRKGAEARRCAVMRSVRLSTFDMVLPC
jgi:hypothetical protein